MLTKTSLVDWCFFLDQKLYTLEDQTFKELVDHTEKSKRSIMCRVHPELSFPGFRVEMTFARLKDFGNFVVVSTSFMKVMIYVLVAGPQFLMNSG
jgi:hypothetical protein